MKSTKALCPVCKKTVSITKAGIFRYHGAQRSNGTYHTGCQMGGQIVSKEVSIQEEVLTFTKSSLIKYLQDNIELIVSVDIDYADYYCNSQVARAKAYVSLFGEEITSDTDSVSITY